MWRIIGTAGHIDHGKTSLVRALTGQDTDRLPQEKARGITIELGFAYLQLSNGTRAGVVDVPGHERFIRTMLAGAHGVDLVLFTVAADDGVMPQTIEHLDIVRLLGVRQAIVVITKTDLVSPARVGDVAAQMDQLLVRTRFAGSPVVPISAITGEGVQALRLEIERMLAGTSAGETTVDACAEDSHASEFFRLPVDRVFVLSGHGTVVTGTARGGAIRTGDTVRIMPAGALARVRHIQVHGETASIATHGQRVALNLAGSDLSALRRGCTIADRRLTTATTQFDATLEVVSSAERGIRSHQRVRVHAGTAERFGRVVLVGAGAVPPSGASYCRLVLSEPLFVMRGDRYVVRDETARHTLGGGAILHPWPDGRIRRNEAGQKRIQSFDTVDAASLAAAFVADTRRAPVSIDVVAQFLNREPTSALKIVAAAPSLRAFERDDAPAYMTVEAYEAFAREVVGTLARYHQRCRLEPGCDIEEVRSASASSMEPKVFRMLIEALEHDRLVVRQANRLRLPDHEVALAEADRQVASRVLAAIRNRPLSPPDVEQLQHETGTPQHALGNLLRVLEREQVVVKVGGAFYFLRETIEQARDEVAACADASGTITAASVRDRLGTTRKYTIPLLEYFDRTGLTIRVGDVHRLRSGPRT
jgi:selenocysteine-specific elongation factor